MATALIRLRKLHSRGKGTLVGIVSAFVSRGIVKIHSSLRVFGPCTVRAARGSTVEIGHDAVLVSDRKWNPVSPAHPTSIRAVAAGARIAVGSGFRATGLTVASMSGVQIGDDVQIGADTLIIDSDFHSVRSTDRTRGDRGISAPVSIGDRVFIGARCIILKGVRIGDDAVIGAGAVVTNDVPEGALAAGNPAKIIRRGDA